MKLDETSNMTGDGNTGKNDKTFNPEYSNNKENNTNNETPETTNNKMNSDNSNNMLNSTGTNIKNGHDPLKEIIPKENGGAVCPFTGQRAKAEPKRPRTVIDWTEKTSYTDVLHQKSRKANGCAGACAGSLMNTGPSSAKMDLERALQQAVDFFDDYYLDSANHEKPEQDKESRVKEVLEQLREKGTYTHSIDEITWGAKSAWRNAARCSGRIVWRTLKLFDCRHVTTAQDMFKAMIRHFDYSYNKGNIRPALTLFRERREGEIDLRVWNYQMLGYAGYKQEDGSVIGDPVNCGFTEFCQSLGWTGQGEMYDLLPVVLSGTDGLPVLFEIPDSMNLTVKIHHPTIPAISNMGLEWIGIPGVSNMMLEAGGIQYTASPFTGWFLSTEVASRDLLDVQRYNLLEPLGQALNLDMSSNATMWKDEVCLELNKAVLDSYTKAGVTMVDQFTNAEQFMTHFAAEHKERGGCPADWVWVVPPQSGSLVPTFHQEMANYHLSPSYEYQDNPYFTYGRKTNKRTVQGIGWMLRTCMRIYKKILAQRKKIKVFYATETGHSKKFAKRAVEVFSTVFQATMLPMDSPDMYLQIKESDISLFITSTFGAGEAPKMGLDFDKTLKNLLTLETAPGKDDWFHSLNFGVFGLGSSAYHDLAAFGKFIHTTLSGVGCNPITDVGIGDDQDNQEGAFKDWIQKAFIAAVKFTGVKVTEERMKMAFKTKDSSSKKFRWSVQNEELSVNKSLEAIHGRKFIDFELKNKMHLHPELDEPKTLLLDFWYKDSGNVQMYQPGDHMSIVPPNDDDDIMYLKKTNQLGKKPPMNRGLNLQDFSDMNGWADIDDFPKNLDYESLLRFVFSLKTVPTIEVLGVLHKNAKSSVDRTNLKKLLSSPEAYEDWKSANKGMVETLKDFPSVQISSAQLFGMVPLTQNRLYSIASSPKQSQVSLVVGVVEYEQPVGVPRLGLTTGRLLQADLGSRVLGFFRPATGFALPRDTYRPVIMIAAGSGIAPFRSFWQQRFDQMKLGRRVGQTTLFFGCRKQSMDLLKGETDQLEATEWEVERVLGNDTWTQKLFGCGSGSGIEQENSFSRHTALSREKGQPRTYVQDIVLKNGWMVYDAWQRRGGHVYVCGKISMAKGVQEALQSILQSWGGLDLGEAKEVIAGMKAEGRYQEDIFGDH